MLQAFLEKSILDQGDSIILPQHTYYCIWIEHGSGNITIDLKQYSIRDHQIYFIKAGQHMHAKISNYTEGYIISFDQRFLCMNENICNLIQRHFLSYSTFFPVINSDVEIEQFMKQIVAKMINEFTSHLVGRTEALKGFLYIFLIYLSRYQTIDPSTMVYSRKADLVNHFFMLLDSNYLNKKLVRDYADVLAVTPGYLNEIVKEISGFTASHHIQQRVVLEAKRLAVFEGESMKEIAYTLGFCDPAHFSKYFKNNSGTNFSEFKKNPLALC